MSEKILDEIKRVIYPTPEKPQRIIPFLGAGISLTPENSKNKAHFELSKHQKEIEKSLKLIGLSDEYAYNFAKVALLIAFMMQDHKQDREERINLDFNHLPSTKDLTYIISRELRGETLSNFANHIASMLKKEDISIQFSILDLLNVSRKINSDYLFDESLPSVSQFYQDQFGRPLLWNLLKESYDSKSVEPTDVHKFWAKTASEHLKQSAANHYSIITTNFDQLMENALEFYGIPYGVITTNLKPMHKSLGRVNIRFSQNIESIGYDINKFELEKELSNKSPKDFTLHKIKKPIVLLYKIHGCISENPSVDHDSLVITDNDYISFISQYSIKGAIPHSINSLMSLVPIIFIGYNLNEWNVRSIFMKIRENRYYLKDYIVNKPVTESQEKILAKFNIEAIKFGAFEFIEKISDYGK